MGMTNKEALEIIGKAQLSSKYTSTEVFQVKRAFQHIKSTLEQQPFEDILDKIRAEIEALEEGITSYHNDRPWIFKDEVLQIIDKYKEESENKE